MKTWRRLKRSTNRPAMLKFFFPEEEAAAGGRAWGRGWRGVGGVGWQWTLRRQGDHALDVFGSGSGSELSLGLGDIKRM